MKKMLSIYVATYNHENYIEKALDSIFMQVTDYSYEVLVGEDCSTDNTRKVLKRYENQHLDLVEKGILKIFYRDHNMYREKPNNVTDLIYRSSGKYIIALEGDDFWTDKNKIQTQIEFLENNDDYIAVAHECIVVDKNSNLLQEVYPTCKSSEYCLKHFMANQFPGQTTTVLYRNIYKDSNIETDIMFEGLMPGDRLRNFILLLNGKIKCLPLKMSAYRHITNDGDSWSSTYSYKFLTEYSFYEGLLRYSKEMDNKEFILASESLLFRCLAKGYKTKSITFDEFKTYFNKIDYKCRACRKWVKYKLCKDVLKKEFWY